MKNKNQHMRILVYGAGVLGCNLARNLYRAGMDVTLLARGQWAEEIRKNGLKIHDRFSFHTSVSRIPVITFLDPEDIYDVIFVVVQYTQADAILDSLRANASETIVFVGNTVHASLTASCLDQKNVLFAFASCAGQRERDRVVSSDLKKITIGTPSDTADTAEDLVQQIFQDTKYRVIYEANMNDYLLCHAAFVLPVVFACYRTEGNLKKIRKDRVYLNRIVDANIEGYRAIRRAGHAILPLEDTEFEGLAYRKTVLRFLKLMCGTCLGEICASQHALHAVEEMKALNRDLKQFFDENHAKYPVWTQLEKDCGKYFG